jgi:hypothetical protein
MLETCQDVVCLRGPSLAVKAWLLVGDRRTIRLFCSLLLTVDILKTAQCLSKGGE